MIKRQGYTVLVISFLALIGIICLLFATKWGIGISHDSVIYISAARNLLEGHGLRFHDWSARKALVYPYITMQPMTHFPPLYPLLLATIGSCGPDPVVGARWLNAILFGANIFLVGLMIIKCSGGSIWASLVGSLLMLSSIPMLSIHVEARSEPTFILLGLLGLFLLAKHIENPRLLFLVGASSAIGLAFLTRYAGLALIISGVLGILQFSKREHHQKMIDCATLCAISSVPLTGWVIRNLTVAGTTANRKLAFHPIGFRNAHQALSTLSEWLLLDRFQAKISLPILVAALLASSSFLLVMKRRLAGAMSIKECILSIPTFPRLLLVFVFVYVFFLAVSISFFDAHTSFNSRILSPVYISAVVIVLCIAPPLLRPSKKMHIIQCSFVIVGLTFLACSLLRGAVWLAKSHSNGVGYASRAWQSSETLEQVRILPQTIPIFSNGPDAIYILTGKLAYMIPQKINVVTRQINENYSSELASMIDQLHYEAGVLVYFRVIGWRSYLPEEEELKRSSPLRALIQGSDGTIYKGR